MKILAFLQCQWFKNPDAVRAIYAKHATDLDRRAKLNARFLFRESLTGKRLRYAFGDLCREVVWEEVSTEIGGGSSAVFPANAGHMCSVLNHHRPSIVMTFGKIAADAMRRIDCDGLDRPYKVICGPHPAARCESVVDDLRKMLVRVQRIKAQ